MGSRGKMKGYNRWRVEPLTPLIEGPDPEAEVEDGGGRESSWETIRSWFRSRRSTDVHSLDSLNEKRMDLKLTLGVLGCPLAPISQSEEVTHGFLLKNAPIATSSANYIIQQYLAATGCSKPQNRAKNAYIAGTLRMLYNGTETTTGKTGHKGGGGGESGCFLLWQMNPGMWSMELVVGGCKIVAGSNGKIVWRHIPWLGTHAAKGPQRPLRRIIQGLDPRTTANMFTKAQCLGEKRMGGIDCFVLKSSADPTSIAQRSDGPAEVIRHVMHGYFSQRSGLLVYIEDSHLTRVQSSVAETAYWETTIRSTIGDYRDVDGVLVAHQGRSVATVLRFGEMGRDNNVTRMEEEWEIDDVVFDVRGLSVDYFIPPAEVLSAVDGL